jgi:hypothetical protein
MEMKIWAFGRILEDQDARQAFGSVQRLLTARPGISIIVGAFDALANFCVPGDFMAAPADGQAQIQR